MCFTHLSSAKVLLHVGGVSLDTECDRPHVLPPRTCQNVLGCVRPVYALSQENLRFFTSILVMVPLEQI